MATLYPVLGPATSVTVTGLSTLASANYAFGSVIDLSGANLPADVEVELSIATTNAPAGNKQICLYAAISIDGTNFSSAPASATDVSRDANMYFLGSLLLQSASVTERRTFSLASAMPGGVIPPKFKLIVRNDIGVALTSGAVQYRTVTQMVA